MSGFIIEFTTAQNELVVIEGGNVVFWKYFGDTIFAEDHVLGEFKLVERDGMFYVVPRSILEKNHD